MGAPGPAALGRGVVVSAGQAPPGPWRDAPVIAVDDDALASPAGVVAALHEAWSQRYPAVIALGVDPARFRPPPQIEVEVWTLDAGFEVWDDRLQFLVWANTYDARSGEAVWWWARKAARLGAVERGPRDGPGDVTLPDGTGAWIDGGPRSPFPPHLLDDAAVVHRESVERGRLLVAPGPVEPRSALAPDQAGAVAHGAGPARIIAPAGSGKTRVLTERVRHLITDRGWEREVTLAVAYNKRAQMELDDRTTDFRPRTRTLNSLGYAILADARGKAPRLLGERDTRRLVERLAPIRRHRVNTDPIGPYLEALSQVRLGLNDPADVESWRDDVPGLTEVFPRYRAELGDAGAVDFDEQIYGAVEALLGDGELRVRQQAGCRHLLVDEFQDLTPAHVLMLRLLATPTLDVFGVGDDDQVIYGHAGADPAFLIDYGRLFPGAASHRLEVNYRCPPAVVEAAATLLSYNRRRVPKVIRAGREPGTSGESDGGSTAALRVLRHGGKEGAAALVQVVQAWLDAAASPADVAVLSRVNSLLLAPQVALATAGVPVSSVLRPDVLERTGLRAALAYLRIATAGDGSIAAHDVVEVLRRPSRGLPQWFPDRLRRRPAWSVTELLGIAGAVGDKESPKVERLVDDLVALRAVAARRGSGTTEVLRAVREDVGLGGAMGLLDSSRGVEGSSHLDDLEALEQVAALHPDAATFESWLRDVLGGGGVGGVGVTLSTVHRVKGMEWDRVVLWGANTGILPHRLAGDVEEERRVLHVAITRGRRHVVVMADGERPSPFLAELDGSAPRRAAGAGGAGVGGAGAGPAGIGVRGAGVGGSRSGQGGSAVDRAPLADRSTLSPEARATEESLREWRLARSRRDRVPPFVVLSDRTLRAIVTGRPSSLVALRQIPGIGPTKLELYGDEILALIALVDDPSGTVPA
ncbi:MAG TPA: ATP-dependent DNA helicase UvrD2 [Acidimicrobiales bacterium]|nr:ATP-dependent DNA helicase UvrD2 [Acidimicrobiales bacterium]